MTVTQQKKVVRNVTRNVTNDDKIAVTVKVLTMPAAIPDDSALEHPVLTDVVGHVAAVTRQEHENMLMMVVNEAYDRKISYSTTCSSLV